MLKRFSNLAYLKLESKQVLRVNLLEFVYNVNSKRLEDTTIHQKKILSTTYLVLIIVNLVTSLGYSMVAPIISSFAITLGAGLTLAGALAGIFSLAALCIRPFSGRAIDVCNKWNMCIFSSILTCISFLGYAFASNIPVMIFFRILHGIAFGFLSTTNMVLVSKVIPQERMGEGLGYFGMGQIIAQIFGPNLGIAIKNQVGFHNLFFIISVFTLLSVVLLYITREKTGKVTKVKTVKVTKAKTEKLTLKFNNLIAKECIVYAIVAGLFSLGNGIVSSFLVLVGEERGISNIALFFTVNAITLFIMRLMIGKVVDKSGLSLIVNISLLLTAVSMFVVGASSILFILLFAAVLKAVGQGAGQIALQTACIKKVDVAKVGIATSTYYIGADIGQGFGPIIGGKIADLFSYEIMYYCVAALMLGGIVLFNADQIHSKKV